MMRRRQGVGAPPAGKMLHLEKEVTMLEKIATRAIVPVGLAVTGFVAIGCFTLYAILKDDLIHDATQHSQNIANTVILSTKYAMLHNDRQHLGNMITNIGQHGDIEHLRIYTPEGVISFSADPQEIGQQYSKADKRTDISYTKDQHQKITRRFTSTRGSEVLALAEPIFNDPTCVTACHYHKSSDKVLGVLDLGLNQDHLQNSLAIMRYRMILFTLMTLMLTVGGVAALLNRSFIAPIKKLIVVTNDEDNPVANQPFTGYGELTQLAQNFQRILGRLRDCRAQLASIKTQHKDTSGTKQDRNSL